MANENPSFPLSPCVIEWITLDRATCWRTDAFSMYAGNTDSRKSEPTST
jgi:hypothetical protein